MASPSSSSSNVCQDLDGKAIAKTIQSELKEQIETAMLSSDETPTSTKPGLAVVLVGNRRDSQTYVNMKVKACAQVGIESFQHLLEDTITQVQLLELVQQLNANPNVHGILVQLPLPRHMDETKILTSILPEKDVDGLHPLNVAKLVHTGTHDHVRLDWTRLDQIPFPIACTPLGCMELLDRSGVELQGTRAVVIGRSNLVGIPVAMLLMHRNATVTMVHSKTIQPKSIVQQADVVIVAMGKAQFVTADWIKDGAVVIDVGINSIPAATSKNKRGYQLVGDCDTESIRTKARLVTPVPGGVGPMTIAMLLRNTYHAWKRTTKQQQEKTTNA